MKPQAVFIVIIVAIICLLSSVSIIQASDDFAGVYAATEDGVVICRNFTSASNYNESLDAGDKTALMQMLVKRDCKIFFPSAEHELRLNVYTNVLTDKVYKVRFVGGTADLYTIDKMFRFGWLVKE